MRYSAKLFGLMAVTSLVTAVVQLPVYSKGVQGQQASLQTKQDDASATVLLEVEGLLEEGDTILDDGSLYDPYTIEGKAGQTIAITLESIEFDTFLVFRDSQGEEIARNDDIDTEAGNYNSFITVTLPTDGTYQIWVNGLDETSQGSYSLTVIETTPEQAVPRLSSASTIQIEANRLLQQGIQQYRVSQFREALQSWEQALEIYREISDHSSEGSILSNIGLVYGDLAQYEQALSYYQDALAIRREVGDRSGEGVTLNNIGVIYRSLSQNEQALSTYQDALLIAQETGNRIVEGTTLNNIGLVYDYLAQYEQALSYYQDALAIRREVGDRSGEGSTLNNVGSVYSSLGQYEQALSNYQDALVIHREIGNRSDEGSTLNNLGALYYNLGQYEQALSYYQNALAIRREIGDRYGEGVTLNNIGHIYDSRGQNDQALSYYQDALAIFQEIGDRYGEGTILSNIGGIYDNPNQYEQALSYYQNALAIRREIGDRSGEGVTLNNIGVAYKNLGQYEQALSYYQDALLILQEIGERGEQGLTFNNIGSVLESTEEPELAIIFYKRSVNIYESIRDDIQNLDEEIQSSYAKSISDTYRTLAELLLQQDRILEAQEVLDLLKLQELDDYLRDIRRGSDTPVQQLDFWPAEQAILDFYNQQFQADSSFSFTDFINSTAVTQQVEQLRRTATGQNLNPDQLARLQDNLQQAGNAALLYPLILDDKIELVLVTTSGLIRETVPVDRVELNRVITDFRRDITDPRSNPTANAQKLYQWLIAPIAQQLAQAEVDTILYAADGTLRYIPLAALHDGEQWLTQQYTINHITAASLTDFRRDRTTNLNILAGAFPADTGYSVEINGESRFYQGLPAAKAEVETIQADIPSTNALFDQQFNPAAVVPKLSDYSIVHFATHAQFVSGFPHESFILFGNGERVTLRDIGEWSLPNAELVVLSACETAVSEGLGNGEEILGFGYQMQRIGVEAAIASLWSVSDGGTQVLMNEFYNALNQGMGKAEALQLAQSALVTGEFTAVGNTRGDDGRIVAISTATGLPTSVSNNLDHPYYWAPFILIGNGL